MNQDISSVVAVGSLVVSFIALFYSNRATRAAEQQAKSADEQAKAIPAQLEAAHISANAAKQQAEIAVAAAEETKKIARLSETQIKAALRPILELERRPPTLYDPIDYLVNKGDGIALNVRVSYGTNVPPAIQVPLTVAAGGETITKIDWTRVKDESLFLIYESEDGRCFRTTITVGSNWHPLHHHELIP